MATIADVEWQAREALVRLGRLRFQAAAAAGVPRRDAWTDARIAMSETAFDEALAAERDFTRLAGAAVAACYGMACEPLAVAALLRLDDAIRGVAQAVRNRDGYATAFRAAGDAIRAIRPLLNLVPAAARAADATDADREVVLCNQWNSISQRQRDAMRAALELGAVDAETAATADRIATRAEGRNANVNGFKAALADLVLRGMIESKRGRCGGCWLVRDWRQFLASHEAGATTCSA